MFRFRILHKIFKNKLVFFKLIVALYIIYITPTLKKNVVYCIKLSTAISKEKLLIGFKWANT